MPTLPGSVLMAKRGYTGEVRDFPAPWRKYLSRNWLKSRKKCRGERTKPAAPARRNWLETGDDRGELRRPDASRLVVVGPCREQAVVGRLLLEASDAGDVVEEPGGLPRAQDAVHLRVDVAGTAVLEAVTVSDQRAPQRGRQAGAADFEEAAPTRLRGAVAFRCRGASGAELGVAGERVSVRRDIRDLAARRANGGQRACRGAVAELGGRAVNARTLLVERPAEELAAAATAGARRVAPEGAALLVVVRGRALVAAEVAGVPHRLVTGDGSARVRVRAGVVALKRGAADAGHPRLRRGVHGVDDRRAVVPDAVERAAVARGVEHALALERHLLEDGVFRLREGSARVVLALAPAGADRGCDILVRDLGVLGEFGLASLVVRRVVDEQVRVRSDRQFLLDVGVDLDVTVEAIGEGRAGVAHRA